MTLLIILKKSKGITIIELLVAVTIAAILITATSHLFSTVFDEYRLKNNADQLVYMLKYAKSEAIKRNETVYVNFFPGNNWCYGINAGSTCNCALSNNCSLGTYYAPAPNVITMSTAGLNSNNFAFQNPNGATKISGMITLKIYAKEKNLNIKVNQIGSVSSCSSNLSGYNPC